MQKKTRSFLLITTIHFFLYMVITAFAAAQPNPPSSLVAFPSYGAANQIVLRWQDNAVDETGFELQKQTTDGTWSPILLIPPSPGTGEVEYRDGTVVLDILYRYQVRAVNAAGDSAWAGPTEFTQLPTNNFWPRDDGVRDIMNIWCGSATGNLQKFHEGIDFHLVETALPSWNICAIRGGIRATMEFWGPGETVPVEVDMGPGTTEYDYYLHLQDETVKSVGDQIAPGEYLGRISLTAYSSGWRHAHIMRMTANSLTWTECHSPWVNFSQPAELDPFGNNPHLLDQSGSSGGGGPDGRVIFAVDATDAATVKEPVRGDVDLLIEPYDDMNTSLAYENNISGLKYWVESNVSGGTDIGSSASPLHLFSYDDDWFSGVPVIKDKFDDVYEMGRILPGSFFSSKRGHHIATSATTTSGDPADADGTRFWRTKALVGSGSSPYYDDALLASHNGEARFPDGSYTVHALMSDQVHIDVEETRDITLDNWLPSAVAVQVAQGSVVLSHAEWAFNSVSGLMYAVFPAGASDMVQPGNPEDDITFTITFSEPMASASLSIPGVTWSSTSVTLTANADATVWTGTLSGGTAVTDPSGIYYLHIDGMDLADNALAGRSNFADFDPVTDLDPDSGATGIDNVHRFSIVIQRDIVLVLDRSGSMALSSPGFSSKMEALIDAGNIFLDILTPGSHINLAGVKYDDVVEVLCPTCNMAPAEAAHIDDIRDGINDLTARNWTSIGGGLTEAANQLSLVGDAKNLVLLFTDGKHNTAPSVADGLAAIHALTPDNTTISAIGFGSGTNINIPQLQDIVDSTDGELSVTPSGLELHKFFIEALMNAGGTPYSIFITDPTATIDEDEVKEHPFTIDTSDRQIAVVVEWGNTSGQMEVSLLSPDGITVDTAEAATNPNIAFSGGTSYALYQLTFPLGTAGSGPLAGEWVGTWRVVVDAADATTGTHEYAYSVISSSELSVDVTVMGGKVPGEKMYIIAKLLYKGKPIDGRLSAVIDYPVISTPNVLASFDISDDTLKHYKSVMAEKEISDTPVSPVGVYTYAVQKEYAAELHFPRVKIKEKFTHTSPTGDIRPGPGEYVVEIPETKIAGDYRITVQVNSVGRMQHSARLVFLTRALKPQVDPKATVIKTYSGKSLLFIDSREVFPVYVEVTPQDRFGNLAGGGLLETKDFSAKIEGAKIDSITDRGNGTYVMALTPEKKADSIHLQLEIQGKPIKVVMSPDGEIQEEEEEEEEEEKERPYSASFHIGYTLPTGDFSDDYNGDYSLCLDFDYHFTPRLSALGLFGYNNFTSEASSDSGTYWLNISANLKYEFLTKRVAPYINGGLGIYVPETGSTKAGINMGLGVDYRLTSGWIIELGGNGHNVFTDEEDVRFIVPHLSLIYRF